MVTPAPGTGFIGLRTVCVFTGTRAEYGLLRPVIAQLATAPDVRLRLLVSGAHLAASHGETWRAIAADGFTIDERVEILSDGEDGPAAICAAMGRGLTRFGPALQRLAPDILLVLGDRYEALAVAVAATVHNIPIAHIHGGELSLGAIDDAFRHALTKLSHLHFTSTPAYRRRVIQLGEAPERVFHVGALGVENAKGVVLLDAAETRRQLGLAPDRRFLLATFHPATLDPGSPESQLAALVAALTQFPEHVAVFTGANADAGGAEINHRLVAQETAQPGRLRFFPSLGTTLYLSAARAADAVVGNSSSALIETPSLGVPSVDIGSRQLGRARGEAVLSCAADEGAIAATLRQALSPAFRAKARVADNPYDKPGTSAHIVEALRRTPLRELLHKRFHDIAPADSPGGP